MKQQKRVSDYGIRIGEMECGKQNAITDVRGVKVGHVTLDDKEIKTGVTAILPHGGNIFEEKVFAAVHVINGFGKTLGTIQIEELGTIETPILLTNTLSVGTVAQGIVEYKLERNPNIGLATGTVNPIVCECNDGAYLNDIRGLHVQKEHVIQAINNADTTFFEGNVGAGTGMTCHKLKGGIGSASRIMNFDQTEYTIGTLILSNHGQKKDLLMDGRAIGKEICAIDENNVSETDKGSIIIIIATDLPMTERQLKRIAKRSVVGLMRTGSYMGQGSGELAIAFSTVNRVNHYEEMKTIDLKMFNPNDMDIAFRAVAECVEESILNSMVTAKTTIGRNGYEVKSLNEYL